MIFFDLNPILTDMGVPKKRASRKRQGDRRTKYGIEPVLINRCASCGALILPHRMCSQCWTYDGKTLSKVAPAKAEAKAKVKADINKK